MDLDAFFERIDAHYKQSLPFVVYRKPNAEEVLGLLQSDKLRYTTTDYTETGFVFAPFDDKEASILMPLEHSEQLAAVFSNEENPSENLKSSIVKNQANKAFHVHLVQQGIDAIKNNDLKKVVLSRRETVMLSGSNPLNIFKRLLSKYPTAFVYCFYHPEVGLWLGATPETLLKIDGHRFFTTALAGTQQYKGTLDVEWRPKEKEEQNMVTNYIEDNLKPLVPNLKVEPVETVKAGNLLHLRTNISGTLDFNRLSLKQIIRSLHPTPAVCGLPKDVAKHFVLEHEHYHREFYTGFLGELNFKEKKFRRTKRHNAENDAFATITKVSNVFVNLRCMQLKFDEAILYVGGGITIDSDPEAEWEETVNKAQTIKSVL
jgi:isochorismate synthase